MPLDYLQHVEPKLEGLTPSLDLSLFREAESKTRLSFVSAYTLTTRLMDPCHNFAIHVLH